MWKIPFCRLLFLPFSVRSYFRVKWKRATLCPRACKRWRQRFPKAIEHNCARRDIHSHACLQDIESFRLLQQLFACHSENEIRWNDFIRLVEVSCCCLSEPELLPEQAFFSCAPTARERRPHLPFYLERDIQGRVFLKKTFKRKDVKRKKSQREDKWNAILPGANY